MNDQNNFMDRRTLLAFGLVAILFIGWQSYLKNKYGEQGSSPSAPTNEAPASPTNPTASTSNPQQQPAANEAAMQAPNPPAVANAVPEKNFQFENSNVSFEITSKGMGLKNFTLKKHTTRSHELMKLGPKEGQGPQLYQMGLLGSSEPLDFEVTQKSANEFEGVAVVGKTKIKRALRIDPETEALENSVWVEGIDGGLPGLTVTITEAMQPASEGSFLMPSFEHQDFFIFHSGQEERFLLTDPAAKIEQSFSGVSILSVGSQYFTSSTIDKSPIIPEAKVVGVPGQPNLIAQMVYKPVIGQTSMELKWISYSGGKSVSNLEKIDKELARVVDLGFFATIGRALLRTLIWFHAQTGNWGIAIILLTLMVRILVLPLNVSTFKSTKKMQKLQPVINSLRERYKDDPQAMNREMMNVWKEHKVNPLGGCLPMLLQLPIFFALYRVLGQSIELYQAPFFGWIRDLSLKDPWYVLPALLAVSMYFQQKMTPTTMDPTQAKIMQFLPLIFALMMVTLPSGLTLYIFVNTLSGIILQQAFMRDKKTAVAKKEAKA